MSIARTSLFATLLTIPLYANAGEWTGTLVDTMCYGKNKANIGNDHNGGAAKGCATACAKMGIQVAVLVDGKMYTIAAPSKTLADVMGKTATISGNLVDGSVIVPEKVMVDGKEVKTSGMM